MCIQHDIHRCGCQCGTIRVLRALAWHCSAQYQGHEVVHVCSLLCCAIIRGAVVNAVPPMLPIWWCQAETTTVSMLLRYVCVCWHGAIAREGGYQCNAAITCVCFC